MLGVHGCVVDRFALLMADDLAVNDLLVGRAHVVVNPVLGVNRSMMDRLVVLALRNTKGSRTGY